MYFNFVYLTVIKKFVIKSLKWTPTKIHALYYIKRVFFQNFYVKCLKFENDNINFKIIIHFQLVIFLNCYQIQAIIKASFIMITIYKIIFT